MNTKEQLAQEIHDHVVIIKSIRGGIRAFEQSIEEHNLAIATLRKEIEAIEDAEEAARLARRK